MSRNFVIHPLRSRRFAFTLVEVLAAMGIFCVAVLGLLYALNVTVDASRQTQRQKMIRAQLESRLARLSLPPLKEFTAEAEENGIRYAEEIRREPQKNRTLGVLDGYWRVRVLAQWQEGGQPQQWDVSHLIWKP